MSEFKRKGDKTRYSFKDSRCIGRSCWSPGMFQHRSPMSCGGSRNTGSPDSPCCMNRAYHGCPEGPDGEKLMDCPSCEGSAVEQSKAAGVGHPDDLAEFVPCHWCAGTGKNTLQGVPIFQPELATKRKADGWKVA